MSSLVRFYETGIDDFGFLIHPGVDVGGAYISGGVPDTNHGAATVTSSLFLPDSNVE